MMRAMFPTAISDRRSLPPNERLDVLFDELAELSGQRNAIDGRIVQIAAEIERDELWGATGARSMVSPIGWKCGVSPGNAKTIAAVAHRAKEFPRCVKGLVKGRLSLDQVGVIAQRAGEGADKHYAQLARVATVSQLRTAIKLEPRPEPEPDSEPVPEVSISKSSDEKFSSWRIKMSRVAGAKFDAALQSHLDAMIAEWKHDRVAAGDEAAADADPEGDGDDHGDDESHKAGVQRPPMPTMAGAFMRLIESSWDAEAARRPQGQQTTVVVHLDVKDKLASLHLGPLLSEADRQFLTCDATGEVWFERDGQPIGAGRATRTISRRLRRALEHRDKTCVVPGCGATRGLHAHHLVHWENGGPTELTNLALLCPAHHRLHHRRVITVTGPADQLRVTDSRGQELGSGSLARPPTTPPPDVSPCPGPTGERADWWWYEPFKPQAPPTNN
jgi:hypothetical protein